MFNRDLTIKGKAFFLNRRARFDALMIAFEKKRLIFSFFALLKDCVFLLIKCFLEICFRV